MNGMHNNIDMNHLNDIELAPLINERDNDKLLLDEPQSLPQSVPMPLATNKNREVEVGIPPSDNLKPVIQGVNNVANVAISNANQSGSQSNDLNGHAVVPQDQSPIPNHINPNNNNNPINGQQQPVQQPKSLDHELQDIISNGETKDQPTQLIIRDLYKKLQASGGKPKLQGELAKDNTSKFDVEAYQLPGHEDQTLYRIKVTYTITYQENGQEKSVSIHRTISTSATEPENAIKAAAYYKNNIIDSATSNGTGDFDKESINQKSFSLRFEMDKDGKISHLKSISFTSALQKSIEKEVKFDLAKTWVYHAKSQKWREVEDGKSDLGLGEVRCYTKEEALMKEFGYKTNRPAPSSKAELMALKEEIDKDVKKAANIQKSLNLEDIKTNTEIYNKMMEDGKIPDPNDSSLSTNMQHLVLLKMSIEENEEKRTEIESDINKLKKYKTDKDQLTEDDKKEIERIKNGSTLQLTNEQKQVDPFSEEILDVYINALNNSALEIQKENKEQNKNLELVHQAIKEEEYLTTNYLMDLIKINKELEEKKELFKSTKASAQLIKDKAVARPEEKGEAKLILKYIEGEEKWLKKLETTIKENKAKIKSLRNELPQEAQIVVTDEKN